MARAKRITERVEDLEAVSGINEPLNILFISFVDSAGRRCKACHQFNAFLGGIAPDASGIRVFIPICEGCFLATKEVVQ